MTSSGSSLESRSETTGLRGATALITGGAGFIAGHLRSVLRDAGVSVHAAGRRAVQLDDAVKYWQVDLTDFAATRSVIESIRPDFVFHLASHVMGAPNREFVLPTFHSNLQTTVNLLTAVADVGCKRVLLTGSFTEPESRDERHIPSSPYAAAKWASSDYGRMFNAMYGVPVAIARVFMVYGPGQLDPTKLVPYVIRSLLRGEAPRITGGGRLVDWIFARDVAEGLLSLAVASNVGGLTFDLGSGHLVSTADLVQKICDKMGGRIRPLLGALPDRPFEPTAVARIDQTQRCLGWLPRVSLDEGLERTIVWYRDREEQVRLG
jgi:nucleoside-diphosphate-sugar epimerase